MARPISKHRLDAPVSVRLFPEQHVQLKRAARRLRMSKNEIYRKAFEFGLPALERALTLPQVQAAQAATTEPIAVEDVAGRN